MTSRAETVGSSRQRARLSSQPLATTPNARPRLSWGSVSTASTRPRLASDAARLAATVDLPTPPLDEQTASRMPTKCEGGQAERRAGSAARDAAPHLICRWLLPDLTRP